MATSDIWEGYLASHWPRRGAFSGGVREAPGRKNHLQENHPLFQVSTHYGNFVIFLDSDSEWLLARGRAMQSSHDMCWDLEIGQRERGQPFSSGAPGYSQKGQPSATWNLGSEKPVLIQEHHQPPQQQVLAKDIVSFLSQNFPFFELLPNTSLGY